MAQRQRKSSPSDLTTRTPVSTPAKADAKMGALGFGLAHLIFKECEEIGQLAEKQAGFRKARLLELVKMGKDDREEFKAQMIAKQAELNEDARAVPNRSLTDYMEDFPKAKSLYVEASRWIGIVKAVILGWSPQDDKGAALELDPDKWPAWRLLELQASKARDSQGASNDPNKPQLVNGKKASGRGKKGRPVLTPQQIGQKFVATAIKDPTTGQALPKNNRNLAEIVRGILSDATVKELNEVAAVVQKQIEIATKAEAEAAKMAAQAAASAKESAKNKDKELKDNQQRTSAGAVVTRTDAKGNKKPANEPEGEREGTVPQS